jgi:hypothetical protein
LQYIIVGGGELDVPPGVCAQQCGWVHDLHETYDRCTALVRFTQNDPVSTMVLEALLHGRYVLCSNVFAGVTPVRNYRDLERSVRDLFAAHCAGALTPQNAAASAVAAEYGPERCVGALEHALDANAVYRITSHIESFTPGASRSERASGR